MSQHHNVRRQPPASRSRRGDAEITQVVGQLRKHQDENRGVVPNALVKARADYLGIGAATLRRYLVKGVPQRSKDARGYVPSERALEEYWAHRGSAAAAHRALEGEEAGLPHKRAFQAAIQRTLTSAERTDARLGRQASREMEIHFQRTETEPNGTWETDLYELPVPVTGLRGQSIHLWLVVFLDCCSRAIVGWAIGERGHGLVLAALGDAIRRHSDANPLRGVPLVLRPDNGLEFAADSVREAAMTLGMQVVPTRPFRPAHKGKVERFFRTLDQESLLAEPLHRDAPRSVTGKPYVDSDDFQPIEDVLLIAQVEGYIDHYNWHRPHSALHDEIPGRYWAEHARDIHEPTLEELRRFLFDANWRKVTKKGVRYGNLHFVAPEINKLVGTWVEVRAYPHDDRQIEIYVGEEWRCTATPSNAASQELQDAVFQARREDHHRAKRLRTKTNRRQRARLKPRSVDEPREETTRLDADDARSELRKSPSTPRRRPGLPAALGLSDQLNQHHRKRD